MKKWQKENVRHKWTQEEIDTIKKLKKEGILAKTVIQFKDDLFPDISEGAIINRFRTS